MNTAVTAAERIDLAAEEKAPRLTKQRVRSALLFLAPVLFVLALVAGWPLLRIIWFGFTGANLSNLEAAEFVGFLNYQYLLTDPDWWNAVWDTFVFALTLSGEMRTVPVAIAPISGASSYELPWGNIMAASVIVTVVLIVLVLIFQCCIVSSLAVGAVKG